MTFLDLMQEYVATVARLAELDAECYQLTGQSCEKALEGMRALMQPGAVQVSVVRIDSDGRVVERSPIEL